MTTQTLTRGQSSHESVCDHARKLFERNPDWVTFFREVLGVEGIARKAFPDFDSFRTFEKSEQWQEIQLMLARLRDNHIGKEVEDIEPTRVITVRLPKSLHEFLQTEAHERRTSMNKLCISKLVQLIDEEYIPNRNSKGSSNGELS